jgi:heme/copper-type cytochrome/quinol oxidase subunit 3
LAASAAAGGPLAHSPAVPGDHLRSSLATSPGEAARAERRRATQPNGWWGMALFLCAEATLFGGLIATYFYLNFNAPRWPPAGIERPSVLVPLILTGVLVSLSLPLALASRAAVAGAKRPAVLLIAGSMAVQCGYIAYQLHLFVDEIRHIPPQGSAYGSIYFTLLGFHHAHVIVGILLDAGVLVWVLVSGLTNYRLIGVRTLALYWHVVNAIAVAVVLTQLSPSL